MHAMYLGDIDDEPSDEELLWWAAEDTVNRAIDTAVSKGYLEDGKFDSLKWEAAIYKGFSGLNAYPDLVDALDRIAANPERLSGDTDEHYDYYCRQMADYRPIYQAYLRRFRPEMSAHSD